MTLDLNEIRARCEAAVPGPWMQGDPFTDWVYGPDGDGIAQVGYHPAWADRRADTAAFIAHARTDVLALVDEVERMRAKNTELNRRATKAEGQVSTTIEDCRRQGVSVGRRLANVGYNIVRDELDETLAREERLLEAIRDLWELAEGGQP